MTLPVEVDASMAAGTRVGEYELRREIGRGAFGRVYEAAHQLLGKRVAIKILEVRHADTPQAVERFVREAQAAARIAHEGIVDVMAFGTTDDGRPYFVMELLEGCSLAAKLAERGRLDLDEAVVILRAVASVVDAAHGAGVTHRDIKPANVFLVAERGDHRVKLLDFGLAKLTTESATAELSGSGVLLGTPHYMSPEQCRGQPVDHRADIYALGVLAFRMLVGRHPFEGDDPVAILVQHAVDAAPRASALHPGLDSRVDAALARMLAKDPVARPATAGAAIDALAAAQPRRAVGRLRIALFVIAAAMTAAAGLGAVSFERNGDTPRPVPRPSAALALREPARPPLASASTPAVQVPSPDAAPAVRTTRRNVVRRGPPGPDDIDDPFTEAP